MQLTEQELESIYNLLHSTDESNVQVALTIIKGREDVKRVFDRALYLYIQNRCKCRDREIKAFAAHGWTINWYDVKKDIILTGHTGIFGEAYNFFDPELEELQQAYSKNYGK